MLSDALVLIFLQLALWIVPIGEQLRYGNTRRFGLLYLLLLGLLLFLLLLALSCTPC